MAKYCSIWLPMIWRKWPYCPPPSQNRLNVKVIWPQFFSSLLSVPPLCMTLIRPLSIKEFSLSLSTNFSVVSTIVFPMSFRNLTTNFRSIPSIPGVFPALSLSSASFSSLSEMFLFVSSFSASVLQLISSSGLLVCLSDHPEIDTPCFLLFS